MRSAVALELFLTIVAGVSAAAEEVAPRDVGHDPAWERYLSVEAVGRAWHDLNPVLLADLAQKLAEGERVVGKPNTALPARTLFLLAIDLAVETQQQDVLLQLANTELVRRDAALAEEIRAATRKLVNQPLPVVEGGGGQSAATRSLVEALAQDLRAARLIGDVAAFEIVRTLAADYLARKEFATAKFDALVNVAFESPRPPVSPAARQYLYDCQFAYQAHSAQHSTSIFRTVELLRELHGSGKGLVVDDVAQLLNDLSDAGDGWKQLDRVSHRAQVVIYYANETDPTGASQAEYDTLVRWLAESADPAIRYIGANLAFDREIFPRVVAQEVKGLQGLMQSAKPIAGAPAAVVVFTNSSVREGKYSIYTPAGVESHTLVFPKANSPLVHDSPLCREDVFALALHAAAAQFSPSQFDFVLIAKSHGSENLLIMPRYSGSVATTSQAEFLQNLQANAARRQRDLAKHAEPVCLEDGTAVRDSQDRRLLSGEGELFLEGGGRLLVDSRDHHLMFWTGEPVRTQQGSPLKVAGGILVLGDKNTPLTGRNRDTRIQVALRPLIPQWDEDLQLAERLRLLADQTLGKQWAAQWGGSKRPVVQLRAKAQGNAASSTKSENKGQLDPSQGGTLGSDGPPRNEGANQRLTPNESNSSQYTTLNESAASRAHPENKGQLDPNQGGTLGDDGLTLNEGVSRLTPRTRSIPLLSKFEDGLLGEINSFPIRFSKMEDGALGNTGGVPRFSQFLTPIEKSESSLRSTPVLVGDPKAGQTIGFGITKEQFVATLVRCGDDKMYFPVVFLESCKSQLPSIQMASLKSTQPVGVLFASDASGLGYQTIDYATLGKSNVPAQRFSGLFFQALWKEFHRQQAVDSSGKAASDDK